jgi:hypothetical protein
MDEIGEYTNVPVDAPYRSVELMKDLKKSGARGCIPSGRACPSETASAPMGWLRRVTVVVA